MQFIAPATKEQLAACVRLNLGRAGSGRVNEPKDAGELATRFAAEGMECATLHVGWGMEDDDQAALLLEAVLEASSRHRVPLYVETHRATLFQDMWRSVQFVKRFPELRFNGDFSHWYTGLEMVYGGFKNKLEFIRPVLERVSFLHGRIGDPGSMQVDIGSGDVETQPYVADFRALWSASFAGFLARARPGDYILFVPELLSPRIYYARRLAVSGSAKIEEGDRWNQALVLRRIAQECLRWLRRIRMPTDLAEVHHPMGSLFEWPKSREEWEQYRLSAEQIAFYHEFGYLAGVRVLNDQQVELLRSQLAGLASTSHPGHSLFYEYHSNESENPETALFHALGAWRIEPAFHDILWSPPFVMAASQLLGGAVRFWHDQLFCKPPQQGGVVAWHQDFSYWTRTPADGAPDLLDRTGRQHSRERVPALRARQPSLEPAPGYGSDRQHGRDSDRAHA